MSSLGGNKGTASVPGHSQSSRRDEKQQHVGVQQRRTESLQDAGSVSQLQDKQPVHEVDPGLLAARGHAARPSVARALAELPEWQDSRRMDALFGTFKGSRDVNPAAWDDKHAFWQRAVTHVARRTATLTLDPATLASRFERNGITPMCLDVVVRDMLASGQLASAAHIKDSSSAWTPWLVDNLVKRPASALWGAAGSVVSSWLGTASAGSAAGASATSSPAAGKGAAGAAVPSSLPSGPLVVMSLLRERAQGVLEAASEHMHSDADRVVPNSELIQQYQGDLAASDFKLVLQYMVAQGMAVHVVSADSPEPGLKLARLRSDGTHDAVSSASDSDRSILHMKATLSKLQRSETELHSKIDACTARAGVLVKQGKRTEAMAVLRQRKRLQAELPKRQAAIDNLTQMMFRVEDAHTQRDVVSAFKSGADAVRSLTTDAGLTPDKVEDAMIDIEDTMAEAKEVEDAITQGMAGVAAATGGADGLDDVALEDELAGLIAEDRAAEAQDALASLPTAPVHVPEPKAVDEEVDQLLDALGGLSVKPKSRIVAAP